MPSVVGIIQARMGSSRLPGKILAPIAGRPLLDLLAARLHGARVDEWWLATTHLRADDVTEAWGHSLGLGVYRGDPEDVLSRFAEVVRHREPEWVVRITADDPFCDAAVVDHLLDARDELAKDAELLQIERCAQTERPAGRGPAPPLGYGAQLARADAILRAEREIPDHQPHHRAHVLSWATERGAALDVPLPDHWPHRPGWRWTVDTFEDLAMTRSAFALFGLEASTIRYPEMVAAIDPHPEIPAINGHVQQKGVEEG